MQKPASPFTAKLAQQQQKMQPPKAVFPPPTWHGSSTPLFKIKAKKAAKQPVVAQQPAPSFRADLVHEFVPRPPTICTMTPF